MKFAAEMPLEWMLRHHDEFNDYLYVLLHLYLKDERYRDFCRNYRGFKLLDNSAYELGESMDNELLYKVACELEPDYVMLPDKINAYDITLDRTESFMDEYGLVLPAKTKPMGIIQGETQDRMIRSYMRMHERLGIRAFGIPFIFAAAEYGNSQQQMRHRITFLERLNGVLDECCYYHLLGTWCTAEFALYETLGYNWVNSFDTSNPIMAALEGQQYRALGLPEKPKTKLDHVFYNTYEELEPALELARYNVRKLREAIR